MGADRLFSAISDPKSKRNKTKRGTHERRKKLLSIPKLSIEGTIQSGKDRKKKRAERVNQIKDRKRE